MKDVIEFLENYIWQNGFEKLSENPFDVYMTMAKSNKHGINPGKARLILITLMSKTHEMAIKGCSSDELIDQVHTMNDLVDMVCGIIEQ